MMPPIFVVGNKNVSKPLSGRSLLQASPTFTGGGLASVSKPLSGRSLLQVVVGVAIAALGHVSKPLSGRSLLQASPTFTGGGLASVSKPLSGRSLLQDMDTKTTQIYLMMSPNR
jgi:hypothetical protein